MCARPARSEGGDDGRIEGIAEALGLPLTALSAARPDMLVLVHVRGALELREGEAPTRRGLRVELGRRHTRPPSLRRSLLARAIGRTRQTVLDATAGFGDDAFAIAALGHHVIASERNPVVAALLRDGLRRARLDPERARIAARIELRARDARNCLEPGHSPPGVVYLDPMFPPKRSRSALPPRKIQLLQRLIGAERDAESLLEWALGIRAGRVVVKRAPRDPSLSPGGEHPIAQHTSKLLRYDVYQPPPPHVGDTAV